MLIWQQSGELQVDLDLLTQLRQNHLIWWRRSRQLDGAAALSWEIDLCESRLVRSPPPLNLDCIMISYTGAGSAQELTRPWSSFSAWGQWWLYAKLWFRPELKRIEKVWTLVGCRPIYYVPCTWLIMVSDWNMPQDRVNFFRYVRHW